MGKSPLFNLVQQAIQSSLRLGKSGYLPLASPANTRSRTRKPSRRDFLRTAAAGVLGAGAATSLACATKPAKDARVVIVGAGISGLAAAWTLLKRGVRASVYEASPRTGGRIWTNRGLQNPSFTTELGGEFIDSNHDDMIALAREFNVELLDFAGPSNPPLIRDAYFFDGHHYTLAEVTEAFTPLAAKLEADADASGTVNYREANLIAVSLDKLTLTQYLDRLGVSGMMRKLIDVAYVTEYGLDTDEQSPHNLLSLIGTDVSKGFEIFGSSDERFRVKNGNQQIVDALSQRLESQLRLGHRLESLRRSARGYVMTFQGPNGEPVEVVADAVILTLPFSLLREVDLRADLPPAKRRAINELGYGTNAKLFLGVTERVWRRQNYAGYTFTDESFQMGWDGTWLQPGADGIFTLFSGGQAGAAIGSSTPKSQAAAALPSLEKAYPGFARAFSGGVSRFHWPSFQYSKGSYSCYRPGQWTAFSGVEIESVGNLHFAGEHCSDDFRGYMNGGAETGRRAAENVLATIHGRRVDA